MAPSDVVLSTGLAGLDHVLSGLRFGDNVVWLVDDIADYRPVLEPLVREAGRRGRPVVYFRFASHPPLLTPCAGVHIHELNPQEGFERFVNAMLDVIEAQGRDVYYIFDQLSGLAADWFSDRMLGNFFMIICPFLYRLETIAYFALQRLFHSVHATEPIFQTAQVIIEVLRQGPRRFVHPKKVWQRESPTMYALHSWEPDGFRPVTNSAIITDVLASGPKPWLEFSQSRPGIWAQTFFEAAELLERQRHGEPVDQDAVHAMRRRLIRMVATRDARMVALAERYFTLEDLVGIMHRLIGSGLIGGKSLGMLLARAILVQRNPVWRERLESHDSFFVGTDVFYTCLVQNDCWWLLRRPTDFEETLRRAAQAQEKIRRAVFPDFVLRQFTEMLEYFGQSPVIVRSSSLLEDAYGNAFSGKYESVFCANQGSPEERLAALLQAVRTVYASAFSEDGLRYRRLHGLLDRDEQMALLIQRVSGDVCEHRYYPHPAGVGFSFNPYVWNQDIDPNAGLLRLVFGLGTRAVNRTDDDYTRLVALNAPLRQPTSGDDRHQYTQRRVDLLDLRANALVSEPFELLAPRLSGRLRALLSPLLDDSGQPSYQLTFEGLFRETDFVGVMRELLHTLQDAYQCPVDIEFTVNFSPQGPYRINLVQSRPFQVRITAPTSLVQPPLQLDRERVLLRSAGPVVGHSVAMLLGHVIYVVPAVYSQLPMQQRHGVARVIGRLTHLPGDRRRVLLLGPGRWGTSMPALGVPTRYADIDTVAAIGELGLMHAGLIPEPSLGTHFFNDLVESGMVYMAVIPGRKGHEWNDTLLRTRPNRLTELIPSASTYADVVWVVDFGDGEEAGGLALHVQVLEQTAVVYLTTTGEPGTDQRI